MARKKLPEEYQAPIDLAGIGVEELLGSAEELGHAATGEPC